MLIPVALRGTRWVSNFCEELDLDEDEGLDKVDLQDLAWEGAQEAGREETAKTFGKFPL